MKEANASETARGQECALSIISSSSGCASTMKNLNEPPALAPGRQGRDRYLRSRPEFSREDLRFSLASEAVWPPVIPGRASARTRNLDHVWIPGSRPCRAPE